MNGHFASLAMRRLLGRVSPLCVLRWCRACATERGPAPARRVTSAAVCAITHIAAMSAHLSGFNICDGEGQLNSFAAMPPIARRYSARAHSLRTCADTWCRIAYSFWVCVTVRPDSI
ncbi:hypothetical protein PCAR4_80028 [Paraburkholderia caribensis]|nr:hypothetical protein PCAR4_80028 [Paraburkholderia caribensis]